MSIIDNNYYLFEYISSTINKPTIFSGNNQNKNDTLTTLTVTPNLRTTEKAVRTELLLRFIL